MKVGSFFKVHWQVARLVGGQDFDAAIRVLEQSLNGGPMDGPHLELIAYCHYWAKREEMAIASAQRALQVDPRLFGAMKFLSQVHARRADHHAAAHFARRALEHYPQPVSRTPKLLLGVLRIAALLFPRLKAAAGDEWIGNPNRGNEQWFAWAKDYLAWYDRSRGAELGASPTFH